METQYFWSIVVLGVLLATGCLYAIIISAWPMSANKTWVEVVIGTSMVTVATTVIIWMLVAKPDLPVIPEWAVLALVPWTCLAFAGGPMIVGQFIKNYYLERDWKIRERVEGKLRANLESDADEKTTLAGGVSGGEGETPKTG
jgi:hypothetical protein